MSWKQNKECKRVHFRLHKLTQASRSYKKLLHVYQLASFHGRTKITGQELSHQRGTKPHCSPIKNYQHANTTRHHNEHKRTHTCFISRILAPPSSSMRTRFHSGWEGSALHRVLNETFLFSSIVGYSLFSRERDVR